MFKKFKEKLKSSLSFFSKKVEEEAEAPSEEKPVQQKEAPKRSQSAQELIEEVLNEKPVAEKASRPVEKKLAEPQKEHIETIKKPARQEIKKEAIKESQKSEAKEPEKKGLFSKAKEALTTKRLSEQKFEELFWSLEQALLENNVAVEVIDKIKNDLKGSLVDRPLPRNLGMVVQEALSASIGDILSTEQKDIFTLAQSKKPFVIAFFGVNGSGKTTTIAKIARLLQQHNLRCVMAAGDTFRAAAIQQLEEHADNLRIKLIKHDYGADAAAVAFDAVKHAEKNNMDIVLIDTAGRLHSDANLMDELKKIVRVAKPDLKLFVGESITGNDCIEQAERFNEHVGVDAVILTKADVDEKGGTALSISFVIKKPILYIGTGQGYGDLEAFNKELVLSHLGLA